MEEKTNYLFVYGTLLDGQNEFAIYLKQNCSFYSKAKFKGRLYDLGEYPGAIVDKTSSNDILGSIVELKNIDEVLKRLDDYEGFGEHQDQPNLFIRKMVSVKAGNENIDCWVYLYNLPVDDFRVIESGDYNSYKRHS